MLTLSDTAGFPSIAFYTDADLDGPIVKMAVQSGLLVVRCQDVGMADASDREHLGYASWYRLVLVSHDANTMAAEHGRWLAEGNTHSGIIIVPRRYCKQVVDIVTYLTMVRDATHSGELDKQLWWFIP